MKTLLTVNRVKVSSRSTNMQLKSIVSLRLNGLQWSYCNVGIGIVFQGQHRSVFFLFKTKKEGPKYLNVRHDLWSKGNKLKTTIQSSLQHSTSPYTRIFHLSVMYTDLECININIQDI